MVGWSEKHPVLWLWSCHFRDSRHCPDTERLSKTSNDYCGAIGSRRDHRSWVSKTSHHRPHENTAAFLDHRKRLPETLIDPAHDRFDGRGLSVCCQACDTEMGEIYRPVFSVNRPNHYIRCSRPYCPYCKMRKEVVPRAGESITRGVAHVQGPKILPRAMYEQMLLPQEHRSKTQAEPMELVCIGCEPEKRALGADPVIVVDTNPQWTLAEERPLYLEIRPICPDCSYHGRFVPKNPATPSIHAKPLVNLAASYGAYDRCIIAKLMDYWPPSRRDFKGKTSKLSTTPHDELDFE
jgi:hypothetical protein